MTIQKSIRLQKLPPYIFAQIDEKKRALLEQGKDLIDLGIGDPDLPTPPAIIKTLAEAANDPKNHRYPSYGGLIEFKKACAAWMERRFNVSVDPKTELMSLIGSKEGLAHFTEAIVNPGDFTLIPDPAYPVYANATLLAGGTPVYYPLTEANQFQPKWADIPDDVWKAVKVVYINFPHNPTSATVTLDVYAELVDRAKRFGFVICSDGAYSEQGYDSLPPCCLQVPGAKDCTIEFFSFSKTYNMTGWRIGFAVGNKELIAALYQIKSTLDSGVFQPIQWAAITALKGNDHELIDPSKEVYLYRRSIMVEGLKQLGYQVFDGGATFYLWVKNLPGQNSAETCANLLERGLVCTPGSGFGKQGEGYFRIALTVPELQLKEALKRFPKV
ncbi:MAG: aspC4 [Bacteriovoracaceae bacterium]|nr:aspC4 [Bacteriovoracaceae bacterium]